MAYIVSFKRHRIGDSQNGEYRGKGGVEVHIEFVGSLQENAIASSLRWVAFTWPRNRLIHLQTGFAHIFIRQRHRIIMYGSSPLWAAQRSLLMLGTTNESILIHKSLFRILTQPSWAVACPLSGLTSASSPGSDATVRVAHSMIDPAGWSLPPKEQRLLRYLTCCFISILRTFHLPPAAVPSGYQYFSRATYVLSW